MQEGRWAGGVERGIGNQAACSGNQMKQEMTYETKTGRKVSIARWQMHTSEHVTERLLFGEQCCRSTLPRQASAASCLLQLVRLATDVALDDVSVTQGSLGARLEG